MPPYSCIIYYPGNNSLQADSTLLHVAAGLLILLQGMASLLQCVSAMQRFPTWMWCNKSVKRFLEWLHDYNLQACACPLH